MDVGDWLRGLGLGQYEAVFRENEIDVKVLTKLTTEDLKDLGVTIIGHRRTILSAIEELSTAPLPRIAPPSEFHRNRTTSFDITPTHRTGACSKFFGILDAPCHYATASDEQSAQQYPIRQTRLGNYSALARRPANASAGSSKRRRLIFPANRQRSRLVLGPTDRK